MKSCVGGSSFERDRLDIPVAIVATCFFVIHYLLMMDLVLHNWSRVIWLVPSEIVCCIYLYLFWWKKLTTKENLEY